MPPERQPSNDSEALRARAADWLAARDRGLTAAEQDDYLQWLAESPEHTRAMARQEALLRMLMRLRGTEAADGRSPAELDTSRRRNFWSWPRVSLAGAAALVAVLVWPQRAREIPARVASPAAQRVRVNFRQTLADGSTVELREQSEIEVRFSPAERRVVLKRGEAYFTVVHDSARPFVVQAGPVGIRDVGTVFDVRLEPQSLEVLVTQGRVSLDRGHSPEITAGQRARVPLVDGGVATSVERLSPAEVAEAMVWQKPRFEFSATPLAEAVADFNRRASDGSAPRLVLGDPELAAVRIGGTLRTDDVEGFVRLLGATEGIRGRREGANEIVLRRIR